MGENTVLFEVFGGVDLEILFLDSELNNASSPIDDYYSLIWTDKYYTYGAYQLYLSSKHYNTAKNAEYMYNSETGAAGIIESRGYKNIDRLETIVKGAPLEKLLYDRCIEIDEIISGNLETEIYNIVTKYALTGVRKIPHLRLKMYAGYTETIEAQIPAGKNLGEWLHEVLKTFEMSYRIDIDYYNNDFVFEIYKGLDRTQEQSVNSWAIFSTTYDNLYSVEKETDDSEYKNYFYIRGAADSLGEQITEELDLRLPDEARREMFVTAQHIKRNDDEGDEIPENTYRQMLLQYGRETAGEYRKANPIIASLDPNTLMDYKLGDKCDIEITDIGESLSARLTELTYIHEGGTIKIEPVFGEARLSIKKYIKREGQKKYGT